MDFYKSCTQSQKRTFLAAFEMHGHGKGKDGLKFVSSIRKSMTQDESLSTGHTVEMLTQGQILKRMGIEHMPQEEAGVAFAALLEDNKKEHNHDGATAEHPSVPALTRYRWVTSLGTTIIHGTTKSETMDQSAQIHNAEQARKALPLLAAATSSQDSHSQPAVKEEVPGTDRLSVSLQALKQQLVGLSKQHNNLRTLQMKLKVKARTDKLLEKWPEEVQSACEGMAKFIEEVELAIAEAECSLEGDGTADSQDMARQCERLEAMHCTADHHIGGSKESIRRYTALLG